MSDKEGLKDFFDYCCITHHYFSLSKCVVKRDVGYASLYICLNVSLEKIKHLPDPMLGEKDHYFPLCDAFKKKTTERDQPLLACKINTKSNVITKLARPDTCTIRDGIYTNLSQL